MVWVSVGGGFDGLHSHTHGLQRPLRAMERQLAQYFLRGNVTGNSAITHWGYFEDDV
jgi:hypothetical protein